MVIVPQLAIKINGGTITMSEFNMYSMTGRTEQDCKTIVSYIGREIDMYIDQYDRVWCSGGQYIADALRGELGEGIAC